jgi:hypothetical protein
MFLGRIVHSLSVNEPPDEIDQVKTKRKPNSAILPTAGIEHVEDVPDVMDVMDE